MKQKKKFTVTIKVQHTEIKDWTGQFTHIPSPSELKEAIRFAAPDKGRKMYLGLIDQWEGCSDDGVEETDFCVDTGLYFEGWIHLGSIKVSRSGWIHERH